MPKGLSERIAAHEAVINNLSKRMAELQTKKTQLEQRLENDGEDKKVASLLEEVNSRIAQLTAKLQEAREQLEREKLQEEKKEAEKRKNNNIKGAIVAAATRIATDIELGNKVPLKDEFGNQIDPEVIEELFTKTEFYHVTREMVNDIIENKEFQQPHYATKLKREDINTGLEYRDLIRIELHRYGIAATGNAEKDEKEFIKSLENSNGFMIVENKLARKGDLTAMMGEDAGAFKDMQLFLKTVNRLSRESHKAFLRTRRNSMRDNGYKKELVDLEKELFKKVSDLEKKFWSRIAPDEQGNLPEGDIEGNTKKYLLIREITYDIERQLKIDDCLQRNNALRQKREMWYVYEKLKGKQPSSMMQMKDLLKDEDEAWKKPQHLKKESVGKGQAVEFSADFAMIQTQILLDRINEHRQFDEADIKQAKTAMACLVIHQLIQNEQRETSEARKPYTTVFMANPTEEKLLKMAEQLIKTPGFNNMLGKNGVVTDKSAIRFIVDGLDKDFARNAPVGMKRATPQQIEGYEKWDGIHLSKSRQGEKNRKKNEPEKKKENAVLEMKPFNN